VTQISEVTDIHPDTKEVVVTDIFNFRDGGSLRPTGYLPTFIDSLISKSLLESRFLYGEDPTDEAAPHGGAASAATMHIPAPPPPRITMAPTMPSVPPATAAHAPASSAVANTLGTSSAAESSDDWYCIVMGQQLGPLSSHDMRRMVRHQHIKPTDMVRQGASGAWMPAQQIGTLGEGR
jgi:hypothetical protein